jgi:uroporphyrinogen-III decarboxylase
MGMMESAIQGLLYTQGGYQGELDPIARLVATIWGKPDRPPVAAQMHDHAMYLAGVPAKKFYYDAPTFFNTMLSVFMYYGMDLAIFFGDAYNYEAEALGAKMVYGENSMPTVDFTEPLIKEHKDLLKLKTPDFHKDGRIPYAMEIMKLNAQMGLCAGLFCAPFSLAVAIRSYPLLIRDMRRDPKFAHELFTFIVDEVLIPYLKVIKEETGAAFALGADAWSAFPNLTPDMAEEWHLPYAKRLREAAASFGMYATAIATLDYCEERPERFSPEIVRRCFDLASQVMGMPVAFLGMGRWQDYDLQVVRDWAVEKGGARGTALVTAGVNARLLRDGPVTRITEVVKRYMDVLGRDGRLLGFLANISADTPPEHVHAAIAAFHQYGRYPIAENLDKVKFEMPKFIPYAEFAKMMAGG